MSTSSISIILPNYNHADYLPTQLNALLSQGVRPLEVIVIDDGSRDDSVAVIERFARRDPIVRLVRNERNLGVVATVNRGLELCRGDYFFGVSADDVVAPDCLENIARMIDRHPEAGIYFGMFQAIDAQDRGIWMAKSSRWTEETFATPAMFLDEYLEVEHCSYSLSAATVYRKRCLEEIGGFREELGHWSDTFALRAIGLEYGACYTPRVLTSFRCLQGGYSSSQARDPRLSIDIVARAAWLMRSPGFRGRFPESHVARWETAYRDYIIGRDLYRIHESIFPEEGGAPPAVPGLGGLGRRVIRSTKRAWLRLLVAYQWRRLQAYVPDLSCYTAMSG